MIEAEPKLLFKVLLIVGMLVSGSINTISKAAQNNSKQSGLYDVFSCSSNNDTVAYNQTTCEAGGATWSSDRKFTAPWTQTLFMFIGEALALLVLLGQRRIEQSREEERLLLVNEEIEEAPEAPPKIFQPILLIPTLCDLTGTTLAGIGLLYVAASVWQMLRGSIIIFTGTFSVIFLKRKLRMSQWLAMLSIVLGLAMVGLASVLSGTSSQSSSRTVLGIFLVLSAQVVSAAQMVLEETFLKRRRLPPLLVTGMEGVFGTVIMLVLVLPAVYVIPGDQPSAMSHGSYENSLDAAAMMGHNWRLGLLCGFYCLSILVYNVCGQSITKYLSAVHRTLIDATRTIIVWVTELAMLYCGLEGYGEAWTKYSPIQLAGFAFLLFGTLLYNGVIKLKFLDRDRPEDIKM